MSNATSHNGFPTSVTATLSVRNWARAIEFYKAAFGASELYLVDGKLREEFTTPIEWYLEPAGPKQFLGPIVLLVNRDTFSAGETFALAMRILPNVTIVGEPTAGAFSDANDAVWAS